jgi:predicted dithiol-disulfide oxidoreductase (DUF899 family)
MEQSPQTEVDALERQLTELRAKLNAAYSARGAMDVPDYDLHRPDGSAVKLSGLFNGREQLILIHNMGFACPYCTMWADGFIGLWRYMNKRAAFVLISNDRPDQQLAGAERRGWTFPMASALGTSMFADMGFTGPQESGGPGWWPGVSTLYKDTDGGIKRHAYAYFGPGDLYNPAWHIFELLRHNDECIEPTEGM